MNLTEHLIALEPKGWQALGIPIVGGAVLAAAGVLARDGPPVPTWPTDRRPLAQTPGHCRAAYSDTMLATGRERVRPRSSGLRRWTRASATVVITVEHLPSQ
jgi:hypothetical protein